MLKRTALRIVNHVDLPTVNAIRTTGTGSISEFLLSAKIPPKLPVRFREKSATTGNGCSWVDP
jgi:hypothetical protein